MGKNSYGDYLRRVLTRKAPEARQAAPGGSVHLLTLVWGTTWAAIRVGLQGMPPFTAVALRFAIATVILLAIARAMKVRLGAEPHEKTLWLVNGALIFSVSYGVVYWSEQYVPSGLAAILFATFALVTLFAHLLPRASPCGSVPDWVRWSPFAESSSSSRRTS
jgi:drug/metabolite transporter (DMT)-like permease